MFIFRVRFFFGFSGGFFFLRLDLEVDFLFLFRFSGRFVLLDFFFMFFFGVEVGGGFLDKFNILLVNIFFMVESIGIFFVFFFFFGSF